MRKNSFGQGLAIFFVIIGVMFVIGSIGEASEPKCIKAGCDNKQASGSSYCYLHKPYTGSGTSHSNKSSSSTSKSSTSSSDSSSSYSNKSNSTNKSSYSSGTKRVQRQRNVHTILMVMAMMISIWMAIMTMIDMTETAIMLMV